MFSEEKKLKCVPRGVGFGVARSEKEEKRKT